MKLCVLQWFVLSVRNWFLKCPRCTILPCRGFDWWCLSQSDEPHRSISNQSLCQAAFFLEWSMDCTNSCVPIVKLLLKADSKIWWNVVDKMENIRPIIMGTEAFFVTQLCHECWETVQHTWGSARALKEYYEVGSIRMWYMWVCAPGLKVPQKELKAEQLQLNLGQLMQCEQDQIIARQRHKHTGAIWHWLKWRLCCNTSCR